MGFTRYILPWLALLCWPALVHAQEAQRSEPITAASVAEQSATPLALAEAIQAAWDTDDLLGAEDHFRLMAQRWPEHPQTLLISAARLERADNLYAALQVLEYAAGLHPTDPNFPQELGRMYYQMRAPHKARPYLQQALALGYSSQAVVQLIKCSAAQDDPSLAEDTWLRYLALYSGDAELQAAYGRWLTEQGQLEPALERWATARQLEPGEATYYLEPAGELWKADEVEGAISLLAAGISTAPAEQLYNELAIYHAEQGHAAAVVSTLEAGLAEFPASELLLTSLAVAMLSAGNISQAAEAVSRALAPDSPAGLFLLAGGLHAQLGAEDQALERYELGLATYPDDQRLVGAVISLWGAGQDAQPVLAWLRERRQHAPATYPNLLDLTCRWLCEQGFETVARRVLSELLMDEPTQAEAIYWQAELSRQAGELETALLQVKQGIVATGGDTRLRTLELELLIQTNRLERALPKAQVLSTEPGLAAHGFFIATRTCQLARQPELATEIAQRGLALHPSSGRLLDQLVNLLATDAPRMIKLLTDPTYAGTELPRRESTLGRAYVAVGSYVLAEAHLSLAVQAGLATKVGTQGGNLDEEIYLLGQAQYFRGNFTEARESLTRALALNPDAPWVYTWLGLSLLETGDLGGARASLAAARESGYPEPATVAWLHLGLGRLAQLTGNPEEAERYFELAGRQVEYDPALASALYEARGIL